MPLKHALIPMEIILQLQKFNARKTIMMEGLVWVSLLSLIVKRQIGCSVHKITGVELSAENNTTVAFANKVARMVWGMLHYQEDYKFKATIN